ncbi:sugar transferase [Psychromonas sp. psych-6C06]|uniref:glycosyltransferase n=1 Tax=Psychromonas sp. psych-6C06 TaxID=2058089 RepID=UPI000C3301D1|nr:glycosyltransferase [Psychromonas sp. psych-6C06]PKF63061.1 sugar transferase [Psychromonas sp. psych-6C06]
MNNLAPIVLFVYNRPEHTQKTLQALQKNSLAPDSELFIYADAPKNESAYAQVNMVHELISNVSGFKKVTIIKKEKNIGLANSIIGGVSEIIAVYGKIIVLEDDLVTSPYFLKFMNSALDFYSDQKDVWHISGWNYPIEKKGLADVFLWRTMNCWGWATWSDRWSSFEKNTEQAISDFSRTDRRSFNLDGAENFWAQVVANKNKKIDTWAIYWYATIFKNNGFCLNPTQTFVDNIGLDGSGVHCGKSESYSLPLNKTNDFHFPVEIEENELAVTLIKSFYRGLKKPFIIRVINKLSRVVLSRNLIA